MPRYIDAEIFGTKLGAVVEASLLKDYNQFLMMEEAKSETAGLLRAIEILNSQPTADVQEVTHGRWIPSFKNAENEKTAKMLGFDLDEFVQKSAYCSVCGIQQITNGRDKTGKARIHKAIFRYCPNCGAKMDGDPDEN